MDPSEYVRIVDLLIQIRREIEAKTPEYLTPMAHMGMKEFQASLETTIRRVEHLAWLDDRGYLS